MCCASDEFSSLSRSSSDNHEELLSESDGIKRSRAVCYVPNCTDCNLDKVSGSRLLCNFCSKNENIPDANVQYPRVNSQEEAESIFSPICYILKKDAPTSELMRAAEALINLKAFSHKWTESGANPSLYNDFTRKLLHIDLGTRRKMSGELRYSTNKRLV